MQINEIMLMLSDLVQELDYDQWKELFDEDCIEDEEMATEQKTRLIAIVRKYIDE